MSNDISNEHSAKAIANRELRDAKLQEQAKRVLMDYLVDEYDYETYSSLIFVDQIKHTRSGWHTELAHADVPTTYFTLRFSKKKFCLYFDEYVKDNDTVPPKWILRNSITRSCEIND